MIFYVLKYYSAMLCICSIFMLLCSGLYSLVKGKNLVKRYASFGRRRNLNFIIIAVAVFCCVAVPFSASMDGRAKLSMVYDGASWGENPDGTRFFKGSIISDDVLEAAVWAGRLDVSAESIAKTLSARPVSVSGARVDAGEFIATEYIIEYKASCDTAHIGGEKMLRLVTDAYLEKFSSQYGVSEGVIITIYGLKNEIPSMAIKLIGTVSLFSLGIYSLNFAFDDEDEIREESGKDDGV